VSTTFSLNWPMAGTARLPLAMDIELVELAGPVRGLGWVAEWLVG
jgi:hypothetical protein